MGFWKLFRANKKHVDTERQELEHNALVLGAMISTMAAVAYADGVIDDAEIAKMSHIYNRVTGSHAEAEDIQAAMDAAFQSKAPVEDTLAAVIKDLEHTDKANVIHAGVLIAIANDVFDPAEESLLQKVAEVLDVGPKAYKDILKRAQA